MPDPRYPIGPFVPPAVITANDRERFVAVLEAAPDKLRVAISGLSEAQLDTSYRDGGWTVRQVVHHVPDSHLNSYVRFKWALTENRPTIKAYLEDRWAELPDVRGTPVAVSLDLLTALHKRWTTLLRAMTETDFARTFVHPETGAQTLAANLAYYAWHGEHHTAQITQLREQRGWM